MKLRRLTIEGIAKFDAYFGDLRVMPRAEPPQLLLVDSAASSAIDVDVDVEHIRFASRFEFAEYLHEKLVGANLSHAELDSGLWAWLTLFYFDQLCPPNKEGGRKAGERARYIPDVGNFRKFYRHLLLGPFMIYRAHAGDISRARGLLASVLSTPGDVVEQLVARQELITNKAVVGVATSLYVDKVTGKLKKGSGGKGPGSPRRLVDIVDQFDVTYDLYAMTPEMLLNLLPAEFNRFRV